MTTPSTPVYAVSSTRDRDPARGRVFGACQAALAFIRSERVGTRVALWARTTADDTWLKLGLLRVTRRGLRAIPTTEGEPRPELTWTAADEDEPVSPTLSAWGQVLRAPTLDYPAQDDDP